ncbi:HAMP domain-containing protein [Candidatus Saccharibacteria bacterium]|nr:HAMP domain-containing histidine kinase [Candidatus Saccharibacteria bacterium]NIV72304.1 HAMP domain-containing protein [Calditrichia bacterium]NIV98770.1 HAMP domain-containing protein [Candidatus Saccharibacteria bacterium]NIW79594.1 HAMP domain-containing protein [Calditrichia bacterium]
MSFKTKIIITFSALTAILVIIISRIGYVSVREIYLKQISDQTQLLTQLIAKDLSPRYLSFLEEERPQSLASEYYRETLLNQAKGMSLPNAFIFDADYNILVQTDTQSIATRHDSRLRLNRREIESLKIDKATTSLPFQADNGQWYLWGFYRLDKRYWLGIRENASRLAEVESLSLLFWGIGLSGVALAIVSGWLLARTLAKPVDKLVNFSRSLGEGNFSTSLPLSIKGELSILAEAMDKMRHDLAQHHREKEKMLAQIAHEIRNPLGGIELLAGLVKEDLVAKGGKTEYIRKILDEVTGLKTLITSYLNFSRPATPTPEWVPIKELAAEINGIFQNRIDQKNVQLVYNESEGKIWFDRHHLRQIMMNLVSNSLEMIGDDGAIKINSSRNRAETTITIVDDGPGIPENELQDIFEPFFTTRVNGTGLGLAVCKKLCEENQAKISVRNNQNQGCAFTIIKNNK